MDVAAARRAVNTAALARDRVALVAIGTSLPATQAFAYERHRARAYALALEASRDPALGELSLAAESLPPPAAVLAADAAALHLLLGDPARSITALAAAARSDVRLDAFGRDVLLAATREAPSEWRRAAWAAVLVRHPRAAMVAATASFDSLGDRRAYRVALAATGLLTALVALLALPSVLLDGGAPGSGVTAPSFAAPPSVVVVPDRAPPPRPSDAAEPASAVAQATLVRATPQPPRLPLQRRQPARPRVARPGPVAPVPAPTPAPEPEPQPAPRPAPQPAALAVAPAAAPAPATAGPEPKTIKGKAKGHAKQAAKAAAARVVAATVAAPQPAELAPETQPVPTSEPPGHAKHDKRDKKDKKD